VSIGLKRGTVKLVPYDTNWANHFQEKKKKLSRILARDNLIAIEHIGSTSIPGLLAKPLIDILLTVKDLQKAKEWIPALEKIGYHYKDENDPRRLFFTEGPEEIRIAYIHIAQQGSEYVDEALAFRDYLLANPGAVHEYELLKIKLAKSYPKNRAEYTKSKEDFIQKVISATKTGKNWGEL